MARDPDALVIRFEVQHSAAGGCLMGGEPVASELREPVGAEHAMRGTGHRVFIEGSAHGVRGQDGIFRGMFKIGQDVTARRAAPGGSIGWRACQRVQR